MQDHILVLQNSYPTLELSKNTRKRHTVKKKLRHSDAPTSVNIKLLPHLYDISLVPPFMIQFYSDA